MKADSWYPIGLLLEVLDAVEAKVGRSALFQTGRRLFSMSHEERFKKVAFSAGDVIFGLDGMYHFANRGTGIGGWKPVRFRPGFAVMEKRTPHHGVMEEGILLQAFSALGLPVTIRQTTCLRSGGTHCVYEVTSLVTDKRWSGAHAAIP